MLGMWDSLSKGWDAPEIITAVLAGVAILVSILYGRREAASAARSAEAAIEAARAAEITARLDVERRIEESRPDVRIILERPAGLSDEELGARRFAMIMLDNRSGVHLKSVTLGVVGPARGFGEFKYHGDGQNQPVRRWGWLPGAATQFTFEDVKPGVHPRPKPGKPTRGPLFSWDQPDRVGSIAFLVSSVAVDGRAWPPVQLEAEWQRPESTNG